MVTRKAKRKLVHKELLPEKNTLNGSMPPTTTQQEDRVVEGQRRINLIWEVTQGIIALVTTGAMIYCAINKILSQELTNAFFLIVGFYFSRTNHQAIGGIGRKANEEQGYTGR